MLNAGSVGSPHTVGLLAGRCGGLHPGQDLDPAVYACTQQLLLLLLQLLDVSVHCGPLVMQVQSMCMLCGSKIKKVQLFKRALLSYWRD